MAIVIHAICVYAFLLVVLRIAGRRTTAELTTFDLVLVLIISESIQSALVADDPSLTRAFVVVTVLVMLDVVLSFAKGRLPRLERWIDGVPLVVLREGKPLPDLLRRARIDMDDVRSAARAGGLANLDAVRYAILETDGSINIVPWEGERGAPSGAREQ